MCDRYELHDDVNEIAERFSAMVLGLESTPSYNVCRSDTVLDARNDNVDTPRFIPSDGPHDPDRTWYYPS